jgi:hypothetical protein
MIDKILGRFLVFSDSSNEDHANVILIMKALPIEI